MSLSSSVLSEMMAEKGMGFNTVMEQGTGLLE